MKAKFKINQLAAKPLDIELIHPVKGNTGIMVKMVGPHSIQYRELQKRLQAREVINNQDNYEVISSLLIAWDEEAFGIAWSEEAVRTVILNPENQWISNFLSETVTDQLQFFRTEG